MSSVIILATTLLFGALTPSTIMDEVPGNATIGEVVAAGGGGSGGSGIGTNDVNNLIQAYDTRNLVGRFNKKQDKLPYGTNAIPASVIADAPWITSHQSLEPSSNYTDVVTADMATKTWINEQQFCKESITNGLSTKEYVDAGLELKRSMTELGYGGKIMGWIDLPSPWIDGNVKYETGYGYYWELYTSTGTRSDPSMELWNSPQDASNATVVTFYLPPVPQYKVHRGPVAYTNRIALLTDIQKLNSRLSGISLNLSTQNGLAIALSNIVEVLGGKVTAMP